MSDLWEFSAQSDEDGDLLLEWYKNKGNVVTICLSTARNEINWAALVDSTSHHGKVQQTVFIRNCARCKKEIRSAQPMTATVVYCSNECAD